MSCQVPSKTLVHELVNTRLTSNADSQINSISNNKAFTTYKDELELYIDYLNTKQKVDPITSEANFWKDNLSKIEDLQPEFIVFWIDKYEATHPKVKEELKSLINVEDTILQNFSDSISNIFRQDENVSARYTTVDDIEFDSAIPNPLTAILQDKLNSNVQSNILNSSTKVNSLFNQNINKIFNGAQQDSAHGTNLTTDYLHLQRITENKPELLELVADYVGNLYEVLLYVFNYKLNNIQSVIPVTFSQDVEGTEVKVDTLGNKVQEDKKFNTEDLLG